MPWTLLLIDFRLTKVEGPLMYTMNVVALPGTEHCFQDRVSTHNNFCWVIDGATRLTDNQNLIVSDWVDRVNASILNIVTHNPNQSLGDIVCKAIESSRLTRNTKSNWHPSATIGLVRLNNRDIDFFILGDVSLIYRKQDALKIVSDKRLKSVATRIRALRKLTKPFPLIYRLATWFLLKQEDRWRNKPSGFWVISNNLESPRQAITASIDNIDSFIIMTDGAYNSLTLNGLTIDSYENALLDHNHIFKQKRREYLDKKGVVDDMAVAVCQII